MSAGLHQGGLITKRVLFMHCALHASRSCRTKNKACMGIDVSLAEAQLKACALRGAM